MGVALVILVVALFALAPLFGTDSRDGKPQL
jgi:hypothetical protein